MEDDEPPGKLASRPAYWMMAHKLDISVVKIFVTKLVLQPKAQVPQHFIIGPRLLSSKYS